MTQCFKGGHDYPIEDEFGAYCEQHGVTAIWKRPGPAPSENTLMSQPATDPGTRRPGAGAQRHRHETRRTTMERSAVADAGKHGGEPSDKPWSPPPAPPSPDGSGPSGPSGGGDGKAIEG